MSFRDRIINSRAGDDPKAWAGADPRVAYAYGHKDARHAAAEIALEAQREIDDTGKKLAVAKEIIMALREVHAVHEAEIARLREALEKIAKGRTGLDPEESDAEWRAYWASLCIDYRGTARAALAQAAEVGNG